MGITRNRVKQEGVKNSSPVVSRHVATRTRSVVADNFVIALWHTVIGKKVVMAVTGVILVAFVIVNMIGNLKIFSGTEEINAYSRFLREIGSPGVSYRQLLWLVRIVLLVCVALHITAAIQLTRMSWATRPVGYTLKRDTDTTFAARMMRWGGVLLAIFIVFHILHFTLGAVGFSPGHFKDLHVYENVVAEFSVWPVAVFYIVAMGALCLPLDHGIWSMLQTLGWSSTRNTRTLKILTRVVANIIVFVSFVSVPVAVMVG